MNIFPFSKPKPVYQMELLSPAGNLDSLRAVYAAGADSAYLGMKSLNMRMHRDDFNFDEESYLEAHSLARHLGKRIYVVVNAILKDGEFAELDHLVELYHRATPDAFIIQELGVLEVLRRSGFDAELHASTMMNCHSVEFALELRDLGISRIVTSRDISIEALSRMKAATGLGVEYFIHGDMCVSESAQCLHSGIVFGLSANRGRCLKSCRWEWELVRWPDEKQEEHHYATDPYLLARRDMCMYRHLPELAAAGIDCLKIEGRMRDPEYLAHLTGIYREAIDRLAEDPFGYRVSRDNWNELMEKRVRDFSTCFAFKRGGPGAVSPDGKREPKFFSSYKIEPTIERYDWNSYLDARGIPEEVPQMRISVRTGGLASAVAAIENGADDLIVGGEHLARMPENWDLSAIREIVNDAKFLGRTVRAMSLRIATDRDLPAWRFLAQRAEELGLNGLVVTNLGTLRTAREESRLPLSGDLSMNLFNARTASEFHKLGLSSAVVSVEADLDQIEAITRHSPIPLAALGHGALAGMVISDCIIGSALHGTSPDDPCPAPCTNSRFALRDQAGFNHDILADSQCRNHLLVGTDVCTLPFLTTLAAAGITEIRLELHHLQPAQVAAITRLYRQALDCIAEQGAASYRMPEAVWSKLSSISDRPLGPGPYFKPPQLTQIHVPSSGAPLTPVSPVRSPHHRTRGKRDGLNNRHAIQKPLLT